MAIEVSARYVHEANLHKTGPFLNYDFSGFFGNRRGNQHLWGYEVPSIPPHMVFTTEAPKEPFSALWIMIRRLRKLACERKNGSRVRHFLSFLGDRVVDRRLGVTKNEPASTSMLSG